MEGKDLQDRETQLQELISSYQQVRGAISRIISSLTVPICFLFGVQ